MCTFGMARAEDARPVSTLPTMSTSAAVSAEPRRWRNGGGNFGKDLRVFIPLSDGEFAQIWDRELRLKLGPRAARLLGLGRRFRVLVGITGRGCGWLGRLRCVLSE